jgi:hypothetical protein
MHARRQKPKFVEVVQAKARLQIMQTSPRIVMSGFEPAVGVSAPPTVRLPTAALSVS